MSMFERSRFKYYLSLVIFVITFILGRESNLEVLKTGLYLISSISLILGYYLMPVSKEKLKS